jgi:hypothetical protein
MVSYLFLVILDRTVRRIATINPEYPEYLDDAPTAIHDVIKTVKEYLKNASRLDKIGSTPDCLNMFKTVGKLCRCSKIFQELSRTTTIAVGCHHGYTRITPMSIFVVIRGKSRAI